MSFEQLGPTFVKLGQLLSTRPDLIPNEFVEEFKKLRSTARPLDFEELRPILEEQYGSEFQTKFRVFDEQPLAAASIAQVHQATLVTGETVVVKVQRPGIIDVIEEDLGVLYQLAHLLNAYVPELKIYDPIGIVDEFFRTLQLETNFIIEANNLRRFQEMFEEDERIKIPDVYLDLCGPKVLVMEMLKGTPLSDKVALEAMDVDRQAVVEAALDCYFQMVFRHGFFHGDLHAGNFFVLPDNRIGLIDFGIVGRLNRKSQDAIISMLVAQAQEDYERVAYEYVDLAPYSKTLDVDRFAKDLRDLVSPYYGLTMKDINVGKLLMDSASVAAKHKLKVPSELMLYFKSMIGIESLGREMVQDFDFLNYSLKFAGEIAKVRYEPKKLAKEAVDFIRDSKTLLQDMPRQLRVLLRKLGSPDFVAQFRLERLDEVPKAITNAGDLNFMGLLIGSLVIAGALSLDFKTSVTILGLPLISTILFSLAAFYGLIAFYKYIRK